MNLGKVSKAISAGVAAGIAAFVPLAAGATHWAVVLDVITAVGAGLVAGIAVYASPANKPA